MYHLGDAVAALSALAVEGGSERGEGELEVAAG
jgi:hypothetical protein